MYPYQVAGKKNELVSKEKVKSLHFLGIYQVKFDPIETREIFTTWMTLRGNMIILKNFLKSIRKQSFG